MRATQNHCRGEKGTETLSSAPENLFITKGHRGNTIFGMFSFGQLWRWMLRFGVTHTERHWACQLSASPPKKPSPTPGNYDFLPHSSPCDFVLFLRSCFTNSFVKPHKSLLSPVKPSLGKQWQGNSPFYTKRRITETAISLVLRLLYRGRLQQTSSTMSSVSEVISNVVHLVCVGVFMHAHYEFPLIAAGGMTCVGGCLSSSEPATKTTHWRKSWVSSREAVEVSLLRGD